MTTRIRALVAALAVLGGTVTACSSGPSQINSAVIIGDRVISVDDVQSRLDRSLANEPATKDLAKNRKLDLVSRGIVNQLVRHELLAEGAKREGLTVSEKDLSDLTAGTGPSEDPVQRAVEAAFDGREVAKDRLLLLDLGKKYANRLKVTVDAARVASPANSQKVAVELAKTLATLKPADVAEAINGRASEELEAVPGLAVSVPSSFGIFTRGQLDISPLFSAPVNTVVAFPLGQGEQAASAGWFVALVRNRENNATLTGAEASAVSQVSPEWLYSVGLHMISPLAADLGVRISPRYGVWDELAVGVVPSEGERFGTVVPVANAKS